MTVLLSLLVLLLNHSSLFVSNTSNGLPLDALDIFKLDFDERLSMLLFFESMGFKNRTVHGDGKSSSSQQSIGKNTTMMRVSVVEVFIVFIVRHLLHWTQCSIRNFKLIICWFPGCTN